MATIENAPYTSRARYYSSADGFNISHAPVPPHVFLAERDRALAAGAPTGAVALDLGPVLDVPSPATTPLIVARYVIVRAGESFVTRFAASGEIHYVMRGAGETRFGDETVAWAAGDIVCLPGGYAVTHRADTDAVLWSVTNEPALAFEGARAPAPGEAPIEAVHYPVAEIRRQLERVHRMTADMTGKAVMFGNPRLEATKTCLPSFTLALNSLPPRESQRAHRHNAVAVTLIVRGERCHSMLDGTRVDWQRDAVMITPPGAVHSHHNEGDELALFLIVQDGGLHYHTRTMGFSYA